MQETKKLVTRCVLVFILGLVLISYNYYNAKKIKVFDEVSMELYNLEHIDTPAKEEEPEIIEEPTIEIEEEVKVEEEEQKEEEPVYEEPYYYYIGTLEIPKIGLSKGFVEIDSPDNTIDKNITIVKGSSYPDQDKGNFIVAAHSGNSYLGFFNRLQELAVGDYADVYYNNIKYTYRIVNIYTQAKTGKINIYRDMNKSTLTLVTCTNNDDTTQTIYIAEQIDRQNY